MRVKIDNIKIGHRYRKDMGDIDALAKSMEELGQLQSIVIDQANNLIAGRRRIEAAKQLGWSSIKCDVVNIDAIVNGEYAENEIREDFRLSEKYAIMEAILPKEKKEAEARQKAGIEPSVNLTQGSAKTIAANKVGSSRNTMVKVEAVVKAAEEEPEKYGDLVDKMDEKNKVTGVYRELKERQAREQLEIQPTPTGKYRVIVIDPPWPVQKILRDVAPNQDAMDYPVMSLEEITALPVGEIAMTDCHLFLWATNKYLPKAIEIAEHWGFRYILTMVWHKSGGFQPFDLPQYNCEFVIYARKGTPTFSDLKDFFCCFNGQRREHSRKPDEFYNMIRRVTDEPRIDYFSREKREGYDQYGNQTGMFTNESGTRTQVC